MIFLFRSELSHFMRLKQFEIFRSPVKFASYLPFPVSLALNYGEFYRKPSFSNSFNLHVILEKMNLLIFQEEAEASQSASRCR